MKYSKPEEELIFEMKRSIINEFRYKNKKPEYNFVSIFGSPEMSIDVYTLQEAFRVGMSFEEKKIIRKYSFEDLFSQALVELFSEELIDFVDSKTVIMFDKGEDMFIIPDRWYKKQE
ncbi:hypothetical protein MHK_009593 [Candidatus Magnetomorum sp. HK-1]|nr:hypothetical protein MHK_009593 [Candidatus Magnetomorum sp. HK-1]